MVPEIVGRPMAKRTSVRESFGIAARSGAMGSRSVD